jgi:hypothetical protein
MIGMTKSPDSVPDKNDVGKDVNNSYDYGRGYQAFPHSEESYFSVETKNERDKNGRKQQTSIKRHIC